MRYTIIVTKERRDVANAFMKTYIDPVGGERTFTNGLNASGTGEPTHYWASGVGTEKQFEIIKQAMSEHPADYQIFENGESKSEILEETGLKVISNNEV